jgi:hypothetical protein
MMVTSADRCFIEKVSKGTALLKTAAGYTQYCYTYGGHMGKYGGHMGKYGGHMGKYGGHIGISD